MSTKKSTSRRTSGVELTDLEIRKLKVTKITLVADRSNTQEGKVRRGLLLKVTPAGSKSFVYRYEAANGKKTKLTLGEYPVLPLANARHLVDDIRQSGLAPKDFVAANGSKYMRDYDESKEPAPVDTRSNAFWVKRYIEEVSRTNRSWEEQKRVLDKHFLPHCGGLTPYEVTEAILLVPINDLSRCGKLRAAESVRNEVRGYFNWLAGSKRIVDQVARNAQITIGGSAPKLPNLPPNPTKGIKFPKRKERSFTVEVDDLPDFISALSDAELRADVKNVLRIQLETFARAGEVCGLPWDELNLTKGIWTLPSSRSKNRQQHIVQLAKQTVTRLKAIKAAQKTAGYKGQYVFPKPRPVLKQDAPIHPTCVSKDINKQRMWVHGPKEKPVRRTTLVDGKSRKVGTFDVHPDLTPHSMRHTAVEWAKESGVPQDVREKLTNHKIDDSDMAQRYGTGAFKKQCAKAIQDFADHLEVLS